MNADLTQQSVADVLDKLMREDMVPDMAWLPMIIPAALLEKLGRSEAEIEAGRKMPQPIPDEWHDLVPGGFGCFTAWMTRGDLP